MSNEAVDKIIHAKIRLEHDIRNAQATNTHVIAVFLDLTAAFDKLWNTGALLYFKKIGIKGRLLYWLTDFLKSRKIKVKYAGETTQIEETINGCPQGSVLSPIIFSLVMNTLKHAIDEHNDSIHNLHKINLSQFVDDGAIWTTTKKYINKGILSIQSALRTIEKWSEEFGFKINPTKTQVIIFRDKNSKLDEFNPKFPSLSLCGKKLKYADNAKFLGMTFDSKLKWDKHINELIKRCDKDINLLKCIKGQDWGCNKISLMTIYKGLIKSKLNYGSIIYNTASDYLLNKLQKLSNRALRIVTGCPKWSRATPLIIECAEIPLNLEREINMLKYWARSIRLNDQLPINKHIGDNLNLICRIQRNKKHIKLPYANKVHQLTKKYGLSSDDLAKPSYKSLSGMSAPKVDTSLTNKINKKRPV